MRKIYLLAVVLILSLKAYSQQDPQFTMYMFNQLAVNPAYAGSRGCLSTTVHYRQQWVGIDGAPKTVTFGIHSPLRNERVSLGLNVVNDKLGVSNFTNLALSYAYRIQVSKKGKLAIGLQAVVTNLVNKFTELNPVTSGDQPFTANSAKLMPNFGAGLYYNTDRAYVGLTVPHIINNNFDTKSNGTVSTEKARQYRHLFLMGGYLFDLTPSLKFKPSTVLKYAPNSPWEIDLNGSFLFYDALWLGASWRSNFSNQRDRLTESVDFMAIYEVNQNMRAGVAYDITTTKLRTQNRGSYEIMLGYDFDHKGTKILTPRYF